jgi:hypothetical protein
MPATFTLLKSTPYTACYLVEAGDGNPGTLDYSSAPRIAELHPGPYRTFMERNVGDLAALNLDAGAWNAAGKRRIRIFHVSGSAPAGNSELHPTPATYTLAWIANGLQAVLPHAESAWRILIEIRFIHSARR